MSDLDKRQKNAMTGLPLAQIEFDKGILFANLEGIDPDKVDVISLSLQMFDHLLEPLVMRGGASENNIKQAMVKILEPMLPGTPKPLLKGAATKVLSRIANIKNNGEKFDLKYFDPKTKRHLSHFFRYLKFEQEHATGEFVYYVTPEAATLFFSMFTVDPMLQQAVQHEMIKRLLLEGRYDAAVQIAESSSRVSRELMVSLHHRLLQLRRNPRTEGWVSKTVPELEEARDHISQRMEEERQLLRNLETLIDSQPDKTSREKLFDLKRVVEECDQYHSDLFGQIMKVLQNYEELQLRAFISPYANMFYAPEDQVLPEVLSLKMQDVVSLSNSVGHKLSPPSPPKVFNLFVLLECFENSRPPLEEKIGIVEDMIEQEIIHVPLVNPERNERLKSNLLQIISKKEADDINATFDCLEKTGDLQDAGDYHGILNFIREGFAGETDLGCDLSLNGRLKHPVVIGSNLAFERNQKR